MTLMKNTIDMDDEVYPIKHVPRHQFPKEYLIARKDIGEEISVKFSCTFIYYEFKKLVSARTGLPMQKFYLVNSKGIKLGREHFHKTMVEPPMTGGKFQLFLVQEKSAVKAAFNKYLDVLFNLLDDSRI